MKNLCFPFLINHKQLFRQKKVKKKKHTQKEKQSKRKDRLLSSVMQLIIIVIVVDLKLVLDYRLVGKKVEVSLRLFDIFERNMVFIFLRGSFGTHPADWGLQ